MPATNISLTIVRHGESIGNVKKVMQGHASGFPLSDIGRNQANLAGIALKDVRFDQFYSSDSGCFRILKEHLKLRL